VRHYSWHIDWHCGHYAYHNICLFTRLKVKLSLRLTKCHARVLCLIKRNAMKTYGGLEVQFHTFLTSELNGGYRSASRTGRFSPGERPPPEPIWQDAGWVPEPVWTRWRKELPSLPLPRIEPRSSSPQPNHYTDWATPCNGMKFRADDVVGNWVE
jgi:hypothetical protein